MKPIIRPFYPHMMPEDTAIWTEYLRNPIVPIKEVWYDVHVGQGVLLPVGASDIDRRIAAGITRKRIDVVCRIAGGYWVVEIKLYASYLALGQVLVYTRLFTEEYRTQGQVFPIIMANNADPDLIKEFDLLGVGVIVTS